MSDPPPLSALEDALRASERKYRLVAENAGDLILVRDRQWRLTFVSPSVSHILGYSPAEMAGMTLEAVFGPEQVAEMLAMRDRMVAMVDAGQAIAIERHDRCLRHKNGATVTLEVVVSGLYGEDGALEGFVTLGRDVTALRAAEQALREANASLEARVAERTGALEALVARLESADAAKDAFLAAVSHELRTPLSAVISLAESLALEVAGPLNERQLRYVATIQSSSERLLEVVTGILHYTQLVAGGGSAVYETCRLMELCAASVRMLRAKAESRQQVIELDLQPETLEILGDPDGVLRVLNALLDNAIKFTPVGGRLGLRVRAVGAGAGEEGVEIEVWDTGIGIAADQLPLLFQPFTQLDQRLARAYEGLGLGLAYVQRKVAAMGGTVTVESAPGAGSRFLVTLPGAR